MEKNKIISVFAIILIGLVWIFSFNQNNQINNQKCIHINKLEYIIFNEDKLKCRSGCIHNNFLMSIGCLNTGQNIYGQKDDFPLWKCTGIMHQELFIKDTIIMCDLCKDNRSEFTNKIIDYDSCYIEYSIGIKNEIDPEFDGNEFIVTPSYKITNLNINSIVLTMLFVLLTFIIIK
jgi:hypothetical protein